MHLIITGHDGKKGLELVELELKTIFVHLGNTVKKTIWGESVWQKKYIRYNESVAEEDYLKIQ
ncbi:MULTISPECIES: hypothetical protein [unclassified Butyrivibrio]|uniref:hypothetical protein n=1 Tax=Butyrivibrio sp. LC3010 TaxID=1280680 RepID=UPI00040FA43E|nr:MULTISPECIES: hypothetical protein [unclassified Butyrivibrio]